MKAMVLHKAGEPLRLVEMPRPKPGAYELLISVLTCGVCRTDLHILDGELEQPTLPLVPGHQIVGVVEEAGDEVTGFREGDNVGVGGAAGWRGIN